MFRGIFNKRQAGSTGKRQGRGPSVAPAAPAKAPAAQAELAPRLDVTIDESLTALSRELSGLAKAQVSPAAKERGWASVQRELERRPVRPVGKVAGVPTATTKGGVRSTGTARQTATAGPTGAARPAHSHTWRWVLGSAAAAVAVIATLLGTYGGGLLQTAGNDEHPTTITSVVSSDTTEPVTTVTTDGTTVSSDGPGTTGVQTGTTQGSGGPDTTGGTSTTGTTAGGPSTTHGPSTTSPAGPTTTQPTSPSTTGEQQYTAAQREGSAKDAAFHLGDLVVTDNTSGARSLVAPEAQASLAQMMASLNEPYGYVITGWQSLTTDTVRVTMEINDRVTNGRGELVETIKHFVINVRVDDKGAVITAINAGS